MKNTCGILVEKPFRRTWVVRMVDRLRQLVIVPSGRLWYLMTLNAPLVLSILCLLRALKCR
jgi:hypothetical protein